MNVDNFQPFPFVPAKFLPVTDQRHFSPFMEGCVLLKADKKAVRTRGTPVTKFCGTLSIVGECKTPASEVAQTRRETPGTSQKPAPVKRAKCPPAQKQETVSKAPIGEPAAAPANVPQAKRTSKRKAAIKQESLPLDHYQRVDKVDVSAQPAPAKRPRRKSNTRQDPLAREPTTELSVKALLAKVLNTKYAAKPEAAVGVKKPQVEVTEVSVKALLAKLTTKRKSSTKAEGQKQSKQARTATAAGAQKTPAAIPTACPCCPAAVQQPDATRALFAQKYQQLEKLGEGGFGSVYAGYRKSDCFPVAIKYIPIEKVESVFLYINGKIQKVPLEAWLMLQASSLKNPDGSSAVVLLLDTYDMEKELVLVMERPVPSVDLFTFRTKYKLGPLEEFEARNIMKQLVDAAIKMHAVNVFHRDLKQRNILLEATFSLPRVRLIDFGCSCFVNEEPYREYAGTLRYAPPEYVFKRPYKAGPATVWQLGALLFELLDGTERFDTLMFLFKGLTLNRVLSQDCKDFLWICLTSDMDQRATLEQMQWHPWLL